jgi:hypothetical protein
MFRPFGRLRAIWMPPNRLELQAPSHTGHHGRGDGVRRYDLSNRTRTPEPDPAPPDGRGGALRIGRVVSAVSSRAQSARERE